MENLLFIAAGNRFRCDDAAALCLLDKLKNVSPKLRTAEATDDLLRMIHVWKKDDTVFWLDAVSSGSKPGSLFFFDLKKEYPPAEHFRFSSHGFHPLQVSALCEELSLAPERFFLIGIEGENFGYGTNLSPAVKTSVASVAKTLGKTSLFDLVNGNFKIG